MTLYIDVALPVPLRESFTYRYALSIPPHAGSRVKVPFGGRTLVGVVIATQNTTDISTGKIKDTLEILDNTPCLPEELLTLCQWGANYYQHPIGEVISAALPQRLREGLQPEKHTHYEHTQEGKGLPSEALKRAKKQQEIHQHLLEHQHITHAQINDQAFSKQAMKALMDKGLIQLHETEQPEQPSQTDAPITNEQALQLNPEQKTAFDMVLYHRFQCYLLQGATGSGKTEVYLQVIARVLQAGQQALILIPEIGLSPQTLGRFKKRFSVPIVELHSNIAEGERAKNWQKAKNGQARIVIGTRLASLTPFKNLGVIIIDEEHDRSYKQQDGFKYSARDLSVYRAHTLNIPIILGSATPSLESLHNANTNKYKKLVINSRAGNAKPPTFELIDQKKQTLHSGLTNKAIEAIEHTIQKEEQVLIFVNRRGYAPALICHSCGWGAICQSCDARMTLHQSPPHLLCHYCERRRPIPRNCPNCGDNDLHTAGYGTEQIEEILTQRFPLTEIIRIDRDTTKGKKSLEQKLQKAEKNKACIFIGTQMLAKGHHLPNLTLVVIPDADQGLMSSDFRGLENMGQLITQVAGRAGREQKAGRVLIQSHTPDHPLINTLVVAGYYIFAEKLLAIRNNSHLPPSTNSACFKAESKRIENCQLLLREIKRFINQEFANIRLVLIGPLPEPQEKINGRYRYTLTLRSESRTTLHNVAARILKHIEQIALAKRTRWSLDIDN
ncbi:MAG: primosomal protein N' [Agarilytica sp.]